MQNEGVESAAHLSSSKKEEEEEKEDETAEKDDALLEVKETVLVKKVSDFEF